MLGGEVAGGDAAVAVRAVYRTFDRETAPVRALRGCDLTVAEGELVAVIGPSGCGKSTLLHLVAGLDRPDDGDIAVAGLSLDGLEDGALAAVRRRHIGLVFQFFNLLDGMTSLENVAIAAMIASVRRRAAVARARDLLDLLGIGDKAAQLPATLSGGQRQRLAIARALANQPTVLLADEPTGALDSEGGAEIMELFRRLHREGQTIVLVTHDRSVAAHADRVVQMRDGRMVKDTS
jgi:putative ABC transport system ATP-binding protein